MHLFFELAGVLADPARIAAGYPDQLGAVMVERFGGSAAVWSEAWRHIRRDWDGYWSDLDLTGDDPLADCWEGLFRTTRALFRLANVPEPEKDALIAFSRMLPELVYARFDGLYDGAAALLETLHTAGHRLRVATFWTEGAARGLLAGAGVLPCFSAPMIALDTSQSFDKDYALLPLRIAAPPQDCLVVDANPRALERARAAGLLTALVADSHALRETLSALIT